MDPRMIKWLTVLGAIAVYVLADRIFGSDLGARAREAAVLHLGWVLLRRPGDEPPAPPPVQGWAP